MWWETFAKILTACLHQEQLMATISLLWKVNFCWKPCTDIFIYIYTHVYKLIANVRVYLQAATILRYLPALFAFAFLPSPMNPVMAHYNGLEMKTENKIRFIVCSARRTAVPTAVAKMIPLVACTWKLTSRKLLELHSLKEGLHLKLIWKAAEGEQRGVNIDENPHQAACWR